MIRPERLPYYLIEPVRVERWYYWLLLVNLAADLFFGLVWLVFKILGR